MFPIRSVDLELLPDRSQIFYQNVQVVIRELFGFSQEFVHGKFSEQKATQKSSDRGGTVHRKVLPYRSDQYKHVKITSRWLMSRFQARTPANIKLLALIASSVVR